MDRRNFMKDLAISCAAGTVTGSTTLGASKFLLADNIDNIDAIDDLTASRIPRWRGFNLQGNFAPAGQTQSRPAFDEFDFATMAEWEFDFARLPLSYWVWGRKDDWSVINEEPLKQIDRAVDLGRQYGLHININFH